MYVFGVVIHHGKGSKQAVDDVHMYTWMEHENRKCSNMTASALDQCSRQQLNGAVHSYYNFGRKKQESPVHAFSLYCVTMEMIISMGNTGRLMISRRKQVFLKAHKLLKIRDARMLELTNDKLGFKAEYSSEIY